MLRASRIAMRRLRTACLVWVEMDVMHSNNGQKRIWLNSLLSCFALFLSGFMDGQEKKFVRLGFLEVACVRACIHPSMAPLLSIRPWAPSINPYQLAPTLAGYLESNQRTRRVPMSSC
ncbi:hypothetical protein BS50DRAFT_223694 [Corynespora cassiicola Philippines]|uniref:Uncharacterized protein n=1 Tax=Corynespora cassiicola Philippines TaxID=1448308 RepID=A0A2T2N2S5_CORCC|nr:hypothetical protein BS50DRAFT_223694 [Corynespora cassiicola Philippines]